MQDDFMKKMKEQQGASQDIAKKLAEKQAEQEKVTEEVKKVGREIRFWFPIAISTIISLGLIGFVEAFQADFSLAYVATANFWYKFFMLQVANISLIATITVVLAKRKRLKDSDYNEVKKEKALLIEYDKDDPYIDSEAVEERYRRKTNAWKIYIKKKREKWRLKIKEVPDVEAIKREKEKKKQKKLKLESESEIVLDKENVVEITQIESENNDNSSEVIEIDNYDLELTKDEVPIIPLISQEPTVVIEKIEEDTKSSINQLEVFLSNDDNFVEQPIKTAHGLKLWVLEHIERKRVKRNIKIKENILKYNYMLSDEYILENIDNLKVKFNDVSKNLLVTDVYHAVDSSGDEKIKINRFKLLTKKYSTKVLLTATVSAITGSMILELQEMTPATWFNIFLKLAILTVNALITILDNDDYFLITDMYEILTSKNMLERMKLRHLRKKDLKGEKDIDKKA